MKICKTCDFCKRLYCNTCGFYLEPERKFYCAAHKALVNPLNGCEKWQKKKAELDLSPNRFRDALADIERIANRIG